MPLFTIHNPMPAIPPSYPDVEMGVDCPGCTPSPWAPGHTPLAVTCVFTRIEPCPYPGRVPNGHVFLLAQQPRDPCEYRASPWIEGHRYSVVWYADHAELKGFCHTAPAKYFFLGSGPCGSMKFDNLTVHCTNHRGLYGYGWIDYSAVPIVSSLADGYSLVQQVGTNYQKRTPRYDLHQTNLSRRCDHTHCLINLTPGRWSGP